jgi:ferredoxin
MAGTTRDMKILIIDTKLCVNCGNCESILGIDIKKRFFGNKLELSEDEAEILKDKINKALDKCYLEALKMEG